MKKLFLLPVFIISAQVALAADSPVMVFGVVDNDVTYEKSNTAHLTSMGNSGNVFSKLGFRGAEDLGGGLAASFWLEIGLFTNNGTTLSTNSSNAGAPSPGLFSRRSTISLASDLGEIRLGRDYTPTFWNTALFDPFGTGGGIGANHLYFDTLVNGFKPTGTRASDSIGYFLPNNLNGVYGQLMYAFGGQTSNVASSKDGDYSGGRVGYRDGRLDAALSYGVTEYASGNYGQSNLGLSYLFDSSMYSLKLMSEIYADSIGSVVPGIGSKRGSGALLGFTLPAGNGTLKGSYVWYSTNAANNPFSTRLSLGYVYSFSKLTSVYGTVAHINRNNGSTAYLGGISDALIGSNAGLQAGFTKSF